MNEKEIELIRARISRELGFYDVAGKTRFDMWLIIEEELRKKNPIDALDRDVLLADLEKKHNCTIQVSIESYWSDVPVDSKETLCRLEAQREIRDILIKRL